MTEDDELIERAANVLYEYDGGLSLQTCVDYAASVVAAELPSGSVVLLVGQEDRAMNGVYIAGGDPDDYRDPFALATRMAKGPGIGG